MPKTDAQFSVVKTLKKLDDSTSQIMFWTHVEHVENYAFCNKIYRFCIFDSLFVEVVKMYVDLRSKKKNPLSVFMRNYYCSIPLLQSSIL